MESPAWMEFIKKMTPNDSKRLQMTPNDSSLHSPSKPAQAKKYRCAGCKKNFSKNSNLCRHEKKCPKKRHLDELEDLDHQVAIKERETRLVVAQNKSSPVVIGTQNNNNTQINNNTVNVNILPYENTDVSHLTDRYYQRAFNRAAMCVPQILEKVHFDP